jgi:hypothetical protein
MRRLLVVDQLYDRIGKAKLCVCVFPFGGDTRIADQGIVCPENQGHCIQQKQSFVHAGEVSQIPYCKGLEIAKPRSGAGLV